jgi:geranyl-CoA carboxylase alpha subunit
MGATAVAAAKAIRYEGAGTLEFLLDREGEYYFMEMNTRLQVEHPVTEAITGLDLVELQLRVAAGEALPLTQGEVRFSGHAIEVRLCAESPRAGFMPQSGRMDLWQLPPGVRIEHALVSGAEISPYYDSMIAKVICHGRTRDDARRQLTRALEDTVALGIETNQVFLASCLRHPVFAAGGATTAFVGNHLDALLQGDVDSETRAHAIAAVLLYTTAGGASPFSSYSSQLGHRLPIAFRFDADTQSREASLVNCGDNRYTVAVDGRSFDITLLELDLHVARFCCDGLVERAALIRDRTMLKLHYRGRPFRVQDNTHEAVVKAAAGADGNVRATMNGRVVAVEVAVGDTVTAGQPLLTLEAMKMEHVHAAPVAGKVVALNVAMGDQVAAYRIVVTIEKTAETAAEAA